jgi:hypothetical protein
MQGPLCIQQRTSNDALPGFAYRSISDFPKLSRTAWWLKTQAIFAVIPRQGISGVENPSRINLCADWIAVILASTARLLAINDRHRRSSP